MVKNNSNNSPGAQAVDVSSKTGRRDHLVFHIVLKATKAKLMLMQGRLAMSTIVKKLLAGF